MCFFPIGVSSIRPDVVETVEASVTAVVGRTAVLPCRIRDLGRHKVSWADSYTTTLTFKHKTVYDDKRFSVDTDHKNRWDLRVGKVKATDGGEYVCTVNTRPPIVHRVRLLVVEPPKVTFPAEDLEVNVPEFERVTLNCSASGTPPPRLTWKRPLPQADSHNTVIGTGNVLIIHNTSRECGGLYFYSVDVYEPAEDQVGILLTIKDLRPDDFGFYKCVGRNNMGRAERQMELVTQFKWCIIVSASRYTLAQDSATIPKGRAGASYNRPGVIDTNKGARYPEASSHREGRNSSPALLSFSNKMMTVVALLALFYKYNSSTL
ncbi:hypothetical protein EGW08_022074 [Elysia chlorotica]|uniref:Ig-like domain-containing protein n=1 Tax=Elysia chlorotica TaxID=188477 RepID=A0A433SLY1_ELYCH|nr:hypothetical protein EGW08_022074 [Elysia chlorotica]